MNPTQFNYYGVKKSYSNNSSRTLNQDDINKVKADIIFEELITSEAFINEAREAKKKLIKDPNKFPNLSLKYHNLT